MQAYCMTCRTKREMSHPKTIKTENGKPAIKGVCPKCGTKMYRIAQN
jgi:Zn finger protein HypA/HybF involved in hydrogenase expression